MLLRDHLLRDDDGEPLDFRPSPNQGGAVDPQYLVMHYTAGSGFESSCRHLLDPAAKASAHVVIGRGGEIAQLAPFDKVAWHAGVSRWHGLDGLNRYSIGIELDNAGPVARVGGVWRSWFGTSFKDADVLEATHRLDSTPSGWVRYPPRQIAAAVAVVRLIVQAYAIRDVIGHEDIAPARKRDPGPAFPMNSFRSAVMGRESDAPEVFEATTDVNLRAGPGTSHEKLARSPLPRGTRMKVYDRDGIWCYVDVLDAQDRPDASGWVSGDYVRPVGT